MDLTPSAGGSRVGFSPGKRQVPVHIFKSTLERAAAGGGASGKEPACRRRHETRVQSLGRKDPLEEEMTTHSSIHSWRIPWTEEPGRLQSVESQESDTTQQLNTHRSRTKPQSANNQ